MIERHLQGLWLENPGLEDAGATRERLKGRFPPGASRRMTRLGMLMGSVLGQIDLGEADTIVYASSFAETRALEDYLASFPTPSPTLFQTSTHPSAVQQTLILRHQPVHHFLPLTGGPHLVAHAVQAALLAPTPRVILCGGEERGTWLREHGVASDRTFAFAVLLTMEPAGAIASLGVATDGAADGTLGTEDFFSALRERRDIRKPASPGLILNLSWSR